MEMMKEKKLQTDSTEVQREEKDLRFLIRDRAGRDYYGGDQAWFESNTRALAGCSHIAGLNLFLNMTGKFPIEKDIYLKYMDEMYRSMGALEMPILHRLYDRSPRDSRFFRRVPASFGQNSIGYILGVERFARRHGLTLKVRCRLTFFCSYRGGLNFIQRGLRECGAVTLLTARNRHPLTLYSRLRSIHDAEPMEVKNGMKNHFVTITGIDVSGESPKLIVSTWGRIATIDYDSLVRSWRSPRALSSALYFFRPKETGGRREHSSAKHSDYARTERT